MPAGFHRLRGARAAGRQHGAASPACHSCLEGGGAAYALAAVPLQRRGAAWQLGSRGGSGAGQRASWPLRRSGGAGPHCRAAPQAERVRFSGPRGRCASGGAGRMAARLLRRRMAALPSYGRGRSPLGCIAFHAERGAAEGTQATGRGWRGRAHASRFGHWACWAMPARQ
ncbi:hypothetical protein NDU88_005436 [Pleurodeles waltl]|uniref:Uncharacterized protein n=1 Tax=Pleurodeles waltl TaxID=8319 RepID=A0AAV7TAU1_PLEWA|nr:hypothetical protein NDU88_005436 [Pleurodeles waltl]